MSDEITALLSNQYYEPDSKEAMAMADQLRSNLGDSAFLSLSSVAPVNRLGQNMREQTLDAANTRGRLNRAIASERRELERKKDAEARALKRTIEKENRANQRQIEKEDRRQERYNSQLDDTRTSVRYKDRNGEEIMLDRDPTGQLFLQGSGVDDMPLTRDDIDFMGLKEVEDRGRSAYSGRASGYMTSRQQTAFEDATYDAIGTTAMIEAYKPEYSQVEVLGMDASGLPLVNQAENFLARNIGLYGDEAEDEKAMWWQNFDRFYTLPERNKLFGSALTAPERASWASASINPSMKPEVVEKNLAKLRELTDRGMLKMAENARQKGASEDYIRNNLQFATEGDVYTDRTSPDMIEGTSRLPERDTDVQVQEGKVISRSELVSLGLDPAEAIEAGYEVIDE